MIAEDATQDFVLPIECRMCGKSFDIHCKEKDYKDWRSGKGYIQDVLSYLSASERELLISETCGDCFDKLFSNKEEDSVD